MKPQFLGKSKARRCCMGKKHLKTILAGIGIASLVGCSGMAGTSTGASG